MVRPYTYTSERGRQKTKGVQPSSAPMQDEATRAWNLHAALYYKAGGLPWRLLRNPTDLATCFVGISFYKSLDGDRLLTSVAQVFNERGEGVIVKGAQAQLNKDDRQPHLADQDAQALLMNAVGVYRKEHRTMPARIVVHKTSKMTEGEIRGFRAASEESKIDVVELLSLRRSFTRLFRAGTYPPLRGTFLNLQPGSGILYLRGSVQFFQAYPGMYVPRPLEVDRREFGNSSGANLAGSFCHCPNSIGTTPNLMEANQSPYEQRDASATFSNVLARANVFNQVSASICNARLRRCGGGPLRRNVGRNLGAKLPLYAMNSGVLASKANRLNRTFGKGGGDRNDRQTNKACALYALQPPPLANWNKRNKRQAQPSQVCRAADAKSQQQLSVWLGPERSTTRRLNRLAGVARFRSSGLLLRNSG